MERPKLSGFGVQGSASVVYRFADGHDMFFEPYMSHGVYEDAGDLTGIAVYKDGVIESCAKFLEGAQLPPGFWQYGKMDQKGLADYWMSASDHFDELAKGELNAKILHFKNHIWLLSNKSGYGKRALKSLQEEKFPIFREDPLVYTNILLPFETESHTFLAYQAL